MKVLFLKAVNPHRAGQVAEVAEGYAANYLIPKQLAVPATAQAIKTTQQRNRKQVAAAESAEQDLEALAQALAGVTVHVKAKSAPSGTLYAAVGPENISQAITKQTGYTLTAALQKQLPTLKHVGQHPVTLQIQKRNVTFTLDV